MKVAVFYGFTNGKWIGHKTDELFDILKSQLEAKGAEVYKLGLMDMCIEVKNNSLKITDFISGVDLKTMDAIYFANWRIAPEIAMAVVHYAKHNGIQVINPEIGSFPALTKLGELVKMSDSVIRLPDSYILRSKRLHKVIKKNKLPFGYPFIAKSISGSMGEKNYLVKNAQELISAIDESPDSTFVLQQFIPNDFDYRVIILGGKVTAVIKRSRQSEDTHVNNTSKGGLGVLVDVDSISHSQLDMAVKAAEKVGRSDFAGTDLLINNQTGEAFVLEVNKSPQIETGSNTSKKLEELSNFIIDKARQSWRQKHQ